jgi:glutaconyl-CoA/methylmalonyl-CoA decarboxylase subunit gamma
VSGEVSYRVTVGDYAFDVTLEPGEGGLLARVGDEQQPVAWQPLRPHTSVLTMGDSTREVLLAEAGASTWVALDGYQAEARVEEARALRLAASLPVRAAQTDRVEIRAPMPGRVVSVRVVAGDTVERNTLVVILEAMKMENELRAPQPGRVKEVRVAEGDTVEHGALLVLLEPPAAD